MAFSKAKQYQQTSSQAHQEEKREDPNKIRNERGKITTDTQKYKKIIREYYEQLYANELDNLEAMDKFLETYSLPRQNQEETDNLNRLITRSEIEFVIIKLPANKQYRTDGFTGGF